MVPDLPHAIEGMRLKESLTWGGVQVGASAEPLYLCQGARFKLSYDGDPTGAAQEGPQEGGRSTPVPSLSGITVPHPHPHPHLHFRPHSHPNPDLTLSSTAQPSSHRLTLTPHRSPAPAASPSALPLPLALTLTLTPCPPLAHPHVTLHLYPPS